MRLSLAWVACLVSGLACAGPAPAPVRAEIDALMDRLQTANCQLFRNGAWHSATEAREHMLRKLAYVEKRGDLQSTEQFIELAASKSSVSGKPYQVRCGNAPPVDSQPWLTRQLSLIRAGAAQTRP